MPKLVNPYIIIVGVILIIIAGYVIMTYQNPSLPNDPNPMNSSQVAYNTKVKFAKGEVLEFLDFTLEFLGTRRQESSLRVSLGDLYDFKITANGQAQTISWSSGTGAIGPRRFKISGEKRFQLELQISDKLGKLELDELVISEVLGEN